jgi:hypothetical protein
MLLERGAIISVGALLGFQSPTRYNGKRERERERERERISYLAQLKLSVLFLDLIDFNLPI